MAERRAARSALFGALLYLVAGLTWIFVTDALLLTTDANWGLAWWVRPLKGAIFIIVTALLLYVLLRRALRRYVALKSQADRAADRLRVAIDGSGAAVWSFDPAPGQTDPREGTLYLSQELKALVGYGPYELEEGLRDWIKRVHPEDVAALHKRSEDCLAGRRQSYHATYRVRHRNGEWRWLDMRGEPPREESPAKGRWTGMVWDISELRRADERHMLFSSLFESASDALILLDDAGWIVRTNETFSRLLGRDIQDIEGRSFDAALFGGDEGGMIDEAWQSVQRWGHWAGDLMLRADPAGDRRLATRISVVRHSDSLTTRYLVFMSDVTEQSVSRQRLDFLTRFDPLTRLPNARQFERELAALVDQALDLDRRCALICLDLDRFQAINETLGAAVGDTVLAECAARLLSAAGSHGIASRLHGDTFAVVSPLLHSEAELEQWRHGVEAALSSPFNLLGNMLRVTVAAGLAHFPTDGQDVAGLQAHAEAAMAQARSRGGARLLRWLPQFSAASAHTLRLEGALREALAAGEIECHLQPQVDLATGRVTGAEALARWCLEGQWIAPVEFIPVAEARGLAPALGEYMLRKAAGQVVELERRGLIDDDFRVSVNLSALQVAPELPGVVHGVLLDTGLDARRLSLELTESAVIEQPDVAVAVLGRLRDAGLTLSIDDFGTGFSSLTQLQRMPLDFLKLDRAFVRLLPDDEAATEIVRAILALASALQLRTVAEGVETVPQLERLRELGCASAQGWLIRPAMTLEELADWLRYDAPRRYWLEAEPAPTQTA